MVAKQDNFVYPLVSSKMAGWKIYEWRVFLFRKIIYRYSCILVAWKEQNVVLFGCSVENGPKESRKHHQNCWLSAVGNHTLATFKSDAQAPWLWNSGGNSPALIKLGIPLQVWRGNGKRRWPWVIHEYPQWISKWVSMNPQEAVGPWFSPCFKPSRFECLGRGKCAEMDTLRSDTRSNRTRSPKEWQEQTKCFAV